MAYDTGVVQEIKDKIDILDFVSEYVNLKRAGQNWKGLCPFHHEKTPSFMVNPSKQIFHCFGCHKGGDIFTFLMEHEKLTFQEALHGLAERAGISLKQFQTGDSYFERKALLTSIVHDAALFYREKLKQNQSVINYLSHHRGITPEMEEKFLLGYAPLQRRILYDYLRKKGYSQRDIAHAGLIWNSDEIRDIFFNRIIFPVFNLTGDTIALGGRVIDKGMPKYLNSPETHIFNKGKTLFGLNHARQGIKEKGAALIVEGYFDVIISHYYGFTQTLAPLGTALTDEQARLIKRYTSTAVMVFDGDEAGLRAARRGFGILLKNGLTAQALILPPQEDPDSILRKQGAHAYQSLLDRALPFVDFFLSLKDDKQLLIREMIEIIGQVRDNVLKGASLKELSKKSGINETFLIEELISLQNKSYTRQRKHTQTVTSHKRPSEEVDLLGLILFFPSMLKKIFDILCLDDFTDRDIISLLMKIPPEAEEYGQEELFSSLMAVVQEGAEKQLVTELSLREDIKEDRYTRLDDCIRAIKKRKYDREVHMLSEKIKEAQMKKDFAHLQELLQTRQITLNQQIKLNQR
jgi:DNA primase